MANRPISIVLFVAALLAPGPTCAWARLWTDVTESFHAEAEFVELADKSVRLLKSSGRTVDVPLSRLCPLDRVVAGQLAVQRTGIRALEFPVVIPDRRTVIVVLEGSGTTPDEALKDAFHQAVELVTGTRVDSETHLVTPNPAQENVLTFSNGFVSHYEILDERCQRSEVRRKIVAVVSRRELIEDLSRQPTALSADIHDLYAEAYTKGYRRREGLAMLERLLTRLPEELLTVSLASQPRIARQEDNAVTVEYRLAVGVDRNRYGQVQTQVIRVLENLAVRQGRLEGRCYPAWPRLKSQLDTMFQSRFVADAGSGLNLTPVCCGPQMFHRTRITGLPLGAFTTYAPRRPSTLILINTGCTNISSWRWFEIDAHLASRCATLAAAITYGDGESAPLRHERIVLGPGLPGLASCDEAKTRGKIHTLILSPFFVHHRGDGYCIADVVLSRALMIRGETTFAMEELSRVKTLTVAKANQNTPSGTASVTKLAWNGR